MYFYTIILLFTSVKQYFVCALNLFNYLFNFNNNLKVLKKQLFTLYFIAKKTLLCIYFTAPYFLILFIV